MGRGLLFQALRISAGSRQAQLGLSTVFAGRHAISFPRLPSEAVGFWMPTFFWCLRQWTAKSVSQMACAGIARALGVHQIGAVGVGEGTCLFVVYCV